MKRYDIQMIIALLLLLSVIATATLGYLQAHWEFRQFVPHRYAAYATLFLTIVHVSLHFDRIWRYLTKK